LRPTRASPGAASPHGPDVLVLSGWTPLVCRRHRRWLGPAYEASQYDLAAARDIITAERRLARLLAHSGDRGWIHRELFVAWNIIQGWTEFDPERMPVFTQRWRSRATALGTKKTGRYPPRITTFPEAVTLTTILTDLN
jgi:hypothetical protein